MPAIFYLLLAILQIIEKILFSMFEEVKPLIRLLREDRKIKKACKKILYFPSKQREALPQEKDGHGRTYYHKK